jgi:hypothetical protein
MSCFLYLDDEEASAKVNIDELFERKQQRDLKQLSIFNKILARAQKRIQLTARNKRADQFIWFQIPEYIFGEPIYDKGDCIAYIVNKLTTNGFHVRYIHPNTIFVSWANWVPNYVRNEFKKKTGKLMDEKGGITDPKTDDKRKRGGEEEDINMGLMNEARMGNIGTDDSEETQKKEQRQYVSTSTYKPTGKFVYNPDMFETLENRLG